MRSLYENRKLMYTLGFVANKQSPSRCRHKRPAASRGVYDGGHWTLPQYRGKTQWLPKDEIHCWWLSHSNPGAFARMKHMCSSFLTTLEIEEFTRCKDVSVGELRYIARAFTRSVLLRYLDWQDMPPHSLEFSRNRYGKPAIASQHCSSMDLRFNLSHTEGLIAVAVTNGLEIGIDAERVSRQTRRNITKVADRWFSADESKHLAGMTDHAKKSEHFMKLWTLKEAYAKATGRGLAGPAGMNGSTFRLLEDSSRDIFRIEFTGPPDASKWDFTILQPCEDYVAALCFEKPNPLSPSIRLKSFKTDTSHQDMGISECEPSIIGCTSSKDA